MRAEQLLIDALTEQFQDDPSTPSLVLSKLKGGAMDGQYYGSLVRYNKAFGQDKQVLFKCMAPTLEAVYANLAEQLGVTLDTDVNADALGTLMSEPQTE